MSTTTEEFEAGEDFEDETEVDAEATPLDAEADADAEADYFAAQRKDEVEERVDTEFSADSLQLFLKDVGKVDLLTDRKSTRLNSSHITRSRMPSSA